jgi:hypothetical protein
VARTVRCDAFVSYSQVADGRLAPSLQAGLASMGKLWYQRRALRVFDEPVCIAGAVADDRAGTRAFVLRHSARVVGVGALGSGLILASDHAGE